MRPPRDRCAAALHAREDRRIDKHHDEQRKHCSDSCRPSIISSQHFLVFYRVKSDGNYVHDLSLSPRPPARRIERQRHLHDCHRQIRH